MIRIYDYDLWARNRGILTDIMSASDSSSGGKIRHHGLKPFLPRHEDECGISPFTAGDSTPQSLFHSVSWALSFNIPAFSIRGGEEYRVTVRWGWWRSRGPLTSALITSFHFLSLFLRVSLLMTHNEPHSPAVPPSDARLKTPRRANLSPLLSLASDSSWRVWAACGCQQDRSQVKARPTRQLSSPEETHTLQANGPWAPESPPITAVTRAPS